jgi:metallo-beta-lactamase class B
MPTYPNVGKDYLYTLESLKKIQFDIWVAAHASQFQLHDKRKPGDAYNPEAFRDREGFLASINSIERQYRQRQKDEQ